MDQLPALRQLFAASLGRRFSVAFSDGDCRDLQIVDDSHVLLNDTVWAFPLTAAGAVDGTEPGIQFDLRDIARVLAYETCQPLFEVR